MYDAKRRGRSQWAVFDQSMHRRVTNRLARENQLRHAIGRSLLSVHYQPIVDLETGHVRALEALARWPTGWLAVPPLEFIPIAEETGITEGALMAEVEGTQHVFADVCGAGVGLHLDDFGTGYSSLAALQRFPVNALKIDRSFVASIAEDRTGGDVIVRSTVALAHSLGLGVIAQGIEDRDQLRRLRTLGREYGQGFLFSPAVSAEETRELLAGWSARRADYLSPRVPRG